MSGRWLTEEQLAAYQERMRVTRIGAAAVPASANAGQVSQTADRRANPAVPERDVLAAVLDVLAIHPRVAWAQRMNVGAFENAAGNYVRVGFVGCSDVIGQLKDGRFLAIECKRAGKNPTGEQQAFLDRVNAAGGVAFCARSVDDVMRELA